MKDNGLLTGVIGAIAVNAITVEKWVGIICSAAMALTYCGIQIYRLIRDRDNDKGVKNG